MALENYQTVIGIIAGGNFSQIVQHWQITDPTEPDPYRVAKALATAFDAPAGGTPYAERLQDILAEDDSFISSIRARKVAPISGSEAVRVFPPADLPGAFDGHTESSQVAGCVIWVPNTTDAKHGRTFYPGVSQEALDNGVFVSGYRTTIADLIVDLVDDGIQSSVGTFFPALRSVGPPATYNRISYGYLSPSPGTQRRRLVPF